MNVMIKVPHFQDLVDRVARFETFTVADRTYSAELLVPMLTIDCKDLVAEAACCGAQVLYWGVEAARARRHVAQVEAAYRSWKDRIWLETKATQLESGKFPTDGHCERIYRTHPEYGEWNARTADAQESAECAEAIHGALQLKAELIKAEERILHDEAGGAWTVQEMPRQTIPRQPQMMD
jgi:hypothetical protein